MNQFSTITKLAEMKFKSLSRSCKMCMFSIWPAKQASISFKTR